MCKITTFFWPKGSFTTEIGTFRRKKQGFSPFIQTQQKPYLN